MTRAIVQIRGLATTASAATDIANMLLDIGSLRGLQLQLVFGIIVASILYITRQLYAAWRSEQPLVGLPVVTVRGLTPKEAWIRHGDEVLHHGFAIHGTSPFQIMTGTGPKMVLSNHYAQEVSRNPAFSLGQDVKPEMFTSYPGFEGMRYSFERENERQLPDMIRRHLTMSLGLVTDDLVEEAASSIHDVFGDGAGEEWQTSQIKQDIGQVVTRLSSRVFLGVPLCHDPEWLRITTTYATHAWLATQELRGMNPLTRPILHWFSLQCTTLRREWSNAKSLITREVESKKLMVDGKQHRQKADSITWLLEASAGRMSVTDTVGAQLGLAVTANLTTSEAMSHALLHLCEHPHLFEPLRSEVIEVVSKFGWTRASLYKMELMDSFLKESQRFSRGEHGPGIGRMAMKDVTLSDGLTVRRGTRVLVEAKFWDPAIYGSDVREFDAYRFVKRRQENSEASSWQYSSATPEFMGFGLGEHACPGRFLATNMVKIALSFLLLKYDWKFESEVGKSKLLEGEGLKRVNHMSTLKYQRRQEEIDLGPVKLSEG